VRWAWDRSKDRSNRQKHGLGFATAIRVFADPSAFSELDRIDDGEERWRTIGLLDGVMVVLVAHTYREDGEGDEIIRIISARRATSHERKRYEQEKSRHR
jgi:uncharacterized DUF497 family protein